MAVLLKVGKVLYHESLFLCRDGSATFFRHQVKNSLAILAFSRMGLFFVLGERLFRDEVRLAQLANQGSTDDGAVRERPQLVAIYA